MPLAHSYKGFKRSATPSIEEAFAAFWTNKDKHDITLVGNDGLVVTACRDILASRSIVFKGCIGFLQATGGTSIQINYPGSIVKAMVEYMHLNQSELLTQLAFEERPDPTTSTDATVPEARRQGLETLLSLADAGVSYCVTGLCDEIQQYLFGYLRYYPSLALRVVEASTINGLVISRKVKETACSKVNLESLNQDAVKSLNRSTMLLLLGDRRCVEDEMVVFETIQKWAGGCTNGSNRFEDAKALVREVVTLERIRPQILSTVVKSSGLVAADALTETYLKQAIQLEYQSGHPFQPANPFLVPLWKSTSSSTFTTGDDIDWASDSIKCQPLILGRKYQWTVEISSSDPEEDTSVWLGVALSGAPVQTIAFCGQSRSCAGIHGFTACSWSGGNQVGTLGEEAKFGNGSKVTLTLDLTKEVDSNGTLSLSVDGKPDSVALVNIRAFLKESDGFAPAVSCYNAEVLIVSIQELRDE